MTKNELQEEAVNTLINDKRLIVEFGTGVGKSKVAIDFLKKTKPKNILLVVAETLHKDNWEQEFKKWGALKIFRSNVTIECYASLHKYKNTTWDVIIFDEAHHIGSDIRMDIVSSMKSEYILCLSATFPRRELLPRLHLIFGRFSIRTVGLQKAIDSNILPEPTIYTIPLYLDTRKETETFVEEWGPKEKMIEFTANYQSRWLFKKNKKAYPSVRLTVKCTPYQKYLYLCEQYDFWKKRAAITKSSFAGNKQMQFGSRRKDFLGSLKTPLIPGLLKKLEGKRYICFCTNIDQCDKLGGEYSIHSKKSGTDDIVDRFNNLESNKLFVVFKGIEGMNFNKIECGVFIQLDGKEIRTLQKFGRVLRAEHPEVYIFYYKNTRDEEYLKNALDGIDKKYIKEVKYDELIAEN